MFAPRCEFHAVKSPIWENDNGEVSVSGVLYAGQYGISLKINIDCRQTLAAYVLQMVQWRS